MDIFDEIIETLELERELGTRTVEIDRALLVPPSAPSAPPRPVAATAGAPAANPPPAPAPAAPRAPAAAARPGAPADFAFLTAGALSAEGEALLAKMVAAMGYRMDQVQRVTAAPYAGGARVAVVMGAAALRAFAPEARAALGTWAQVGGVPAVVTYSPDHLLLYFKNDETGMRKGKLAVWTALQGALKRIGKQPPERRSK